MRTTIDIDDDVLQAAQQLADAQGKTAGKVLSDLARAALKIESGAKSKHGFPLVPGGKPVSSELVRRLAADE